MKHFPSIEIIARIDRYLADPRLESEAQLRKRWAWIWMVATLIGVIASIIYFLLALKLWPLTWVGFGFISGYIVAFWLYPRTLRFDLIININYSFYVVLVFFAMLKTGGLSTSLGLVFVGINCAMGSVLAGNLRWTIGIFVLYCSTIVALGLLQPILFTPEYITPEVNTRAFVFLAVWINACILFIVILFMRDKSRYEKAEAEKLRKIDEAKTKLFTNVSHEFRTPLTVIQGIAEQMEQHPEKWLESGPGKIKTQSQILLRLVNQMLNIAKIEADEMKLNPINGDIRKFIQYIASSFQSLAENKDIELQIEETDEPIFTDYDPEKLMHVLANLLSNAIKFTPPGGHVIVEVEVTTEEKQEIVKVIVKDTGRGIPQELIGHIFDRFYQIPDKYDQTPGTGLGLALTLELLKLMNGEIRVNSEVYKGTEFIVILPISGKSMLKEDHGISMIHRGTIHSDLPNSQNKTHFEINSEELISKPVLLIVEDNPDVIEYLAAILEKQFNIEIASNGKTGLKKAQDIIPDLILSDVMMPQMDGFEMLSFLKKEICTDHIPVVLLTARGDFDSKLTGLEIGADHYLVKPFSEKELLLKLNNLLELRRKMQKQLGILNTVTHPGNSNYKQELQFIQKINSLIENNLQNEDFGIKDICNSMNMSRAQLYRKFSAITDKAIGHYLRSFRLHKAKTLLEKHGKNVTEAALETGFKNLSHFSTSFHEEFGFSPKELL